ncbi:MAG: sel1 repeat family protein [Gammaproteobacteria bacterium]|nr:sel1 repeat family protein [Gammaproteobacteria bacterium]
MKRFLISVLLLMASACAQSTDPMSAFNKGDYEKSFRLWKQLAEQGNAEAQNYLGIQYYLGLGVKRDYGLAIEWYEKAARQGYPDAQRNYGIMYQYGIGVPQDFYSAYVWYFAASQQGNEKAKLHLETLSSNKLTPNQQMHAKLEANEFILDPQKRFMSHDTYIDAR